MREIAIIGIGQIPVSENWGQSIREIAGEAAFSALADSDQPSVDGVFVGNMLSGILEQTGKFGSDAG